MQKLQSAEPKDNNVSCESTVESFFSNLNAIKLRHTPDDPSDPLSESRAKLSLGSPDAVAVAPSAKDQHEKWAMVKKARKQAKLDKLVEYIHWYKESYATNLINNVAFKAQRLGLRKSEAIRTITEQIRDYNQDLRGSWIKGTIDRGFDLAENCYSEEAQ